MPRPELPPGWTGKRQRVTWIRWDKAALRNRISHPWMVIVTDPEGTERAYDNWAQAVLESAELAS